MNQELERLGHGKAVAEHAQDCRPAPKWVAVVVDQLFPMPERRVKVAVIREQTGIQTGLALLRDYNSENDPMMPDNGVVDLGEGNVFYTKPLCDVRFCPDCLAPAKLAYSVDDRWEVVLKSEQTGRTLRDLFKLSDHVELLRDFKLPFDEIIGDTDSATFTDGPVFITRHVLRYCINIEGKEYRWNEPTITTAQIRKLGNLPADQPVVCEQADGSERTLREDEVVKLETCCRFGRAPKYKRG